MFAWSKTVREDRRTKQRIARPWSNASSRLPPNAPPLDSAPPGVCVGWDVAAECRRCQPAGAVVDRLRARLSIGRICVVADRRMVSTQTITALEQRKLE